MAACEEGLRVRYVTAAGLVSKLAGAADERVSPASWLGGRIHMTPMKRMPTRQQ